MKFTAGLLPRTTPRRLQLSAAPTSYVGPAHLDRRPEMLPTSDQGNTSKCVAYSIAGCLEYRRWKRDGIAEQIDPNDIYARAKQLDGMPGQEGTTLEDGLQAAQDLGLMSRVENSLLREVYTFPEVQQAIHRYGVILGAFNIQAGWMAATPDGWIPAGGGNLGGHAVAICGASTLTEPWWVAIQNSWGDAQGWRGFNRMPHDLFLQQFEYGLVWGD